MKGNSSVLLEKSDVLSLEERAKKCLGVNYKGLYTFFKEVAESEADYKLLMTRRCYILYKVFEQIYKEKNDEPVNKGIIANDISACYYFSDEINSDVLKQQKVELIDDILVHGNAICMTVNKLCLWGVERSNINIRVYGYSSEPKLLGKDLQEHLSRKVVLENWRNLSNNLLDLIQLTDIPYTSYITSQKLEFITQQEKKDFVSALEQVLKSQFVFEKVSFPGEDGLQNIMPLKLRTYRNSHYIFVRFKTQKNENYIENLLNEMCDMFCLRIYESETIFHGEKRYVLTIVPYIILKPFYKEKDGFELNNLINLIVSNLYSENVANVKRMIACRNSKCQDYKMRLVNSILSYAFALNIYRHFDKNSQYCFKLKSATDENLIQMSFGEQVCKDFFKLTLDTYEGFNLVNKNLSLKWNKIQEDIKALRIDQEKLRGYEKKKNEYNILGDIIKAKQHNLEQRDNILANIIIKEYFASVNRLKYQKNNQSGQNLVGLSTQCFVNELVYQDKICNNENYVYAALLNSLDFGESSAHFRMRKVEDEFICLNIHAPGEGSYFYEANKYKVIVASCKNIVNMLETANELRDEKVTSETVLNNYLGELEEQKKINSDERKIILDNWENWSVDILDKNVREEFPDDYLDDEKCYMNIVEGSGNFTTDAR